jgi:hypothetical protein
LTTPASNLVRLAAALLVGGTVESAMAGDIVPFELCGTLVEAPFCGLALASADGLFLVDDTGSFTAGDVVAISGPITLACFTVPRCSIGTCLHVETIGLGFCPISADSDFDGDVDGSDLAQLLAGWGACPLLTIGCVGDLDLDGQVGAGDLAILLGQWTGSL